MAGLVHDLLAGSLDFVRLWSSHGVRTAPTLVKAFLHPQMVRWPSTATSLNIADRDQRVVICTAAPGSPPEEALRLLAVRGTRRLGAAL